MDKYLIVNKRGIFRPKKTDDLRPDAQLYVGQELLFTYAGTMDKGEAYEGQATFTAKFPDNTDVRMGWVPEEDIEW